MIEAWSDHQIIPGANWHDALLGAIERASVAVLLVSQHFFASSFISTEELPCILAAVRTGGLTILPVLVRACAYQVTELASFQFALPPTKSIASMRSAEKRNEAWVYVCKQVAKMLHAPTGKAPDIKPTMPAANEAQAQKQDDVCASMYRQKICKDPYLIQVQVLDMDHPLTLDDIYVRVQVHHEKRFRPSTEQDGQSEQEHDPLNVLHLQQTYREEREHQGMEPRQAVRKHPHSVIVGDPGAGKTTLLKYLNLQVARGHFKGTADDALLVSLHTFARKRKRAPDENLLEFILRDWQQVYHLPIIQARDFLEHCLLAGRMLILLDALDETMIGDETEKAEQTYQAVHEAVSDLHRAYPQTPMVITARKAAYHQHAHLVGFDILEMVDFLPKQVESFVRNWFHHDPDEERRGMAEGLITRLQNSPRISALAANPLLLGLIAYTYEENNERLPNNRADLYKLCIETLLRKWDDKRKIRRTHPAIDTYEQERLLPRLAWYFHAQGLRYFSRRELLGCIKEFAEAQGRHTREDHLQDILDEITSDNGLLREQAHETYGFLHLTLQEYFTARHLTNIHGLELLLAQLGHPWWEEVVLLYAGQVDDASDLLEHLLSPSGDGEAPEDIFASKLLLAGRCLATQAQIIRNKHLRSKIPNQLLEKLSSPFTLLQQQAAEVLTEIGRTYPEHEVNDRLLAIVADEEDNFERKMIILESIERSGSRRLQRKLLPLLWSNSFNWRVHEQIVTILGRYADRSILQTLKSKVADLNMELEKRASAARLLCSCADSATLDWLLQIAEREEKRNTLWKSVSKAGHSGKSRSVRSHTLCATSASAFSPFSAGG